MTKKRGPDLEKIRREYTLQSLDEAELPTNPIDLLRAWLEAAGKAGLTDPSAMTISTLSREGTPSSRIVLLKKLEKGRLTFFTGAASKKSKELEEHPLVAAHFYWAELERQVRISGQADRVSDKVADSYFSTRPRESQLAAWASPQSEAIPGRNFLEERFEHFRQKFEGEKTIPRPAHWTGFYITPGQIEFWQGGAHRLHDRILYRKDHGKWSRTRLAP